MKKKSIDEVNSITKRLDAIIRLLLTQLNLKNDYGMERIYIMLDEVGLSSGDIGKIVGKESKNISSMINKAKKKQMGKKNHG